MKRITMIGMVFLGLFLVVSPVSAHVVVKPGELGVGERANFTVSVPTEEDTPTTEVRILIPEEIQNVRPNVKPGWSIELVKSGEGEDERITEIIWSGGNIPPEQKDEFFFSSQAPAEEGTLFWKAYQTYADGTIIAWDKSPEEIETYNNNNPVEAGVHDEKAPKPYSATTIVNDLTEEASEDTDQITKAENALTLSIFAVFLGAASLGWQLYKKK